MLHTIRNYINNDSLWFATLKKFHLYFELSNTNTEEVLKWFEIKLGDDVKKIMIRYLYRADIPVLQYVKKRFLWRKRIKFKWKTEEDGFNLPILVNGQRVVPKSGWSEIRVKSFKGVRKQLDRKYALYDIEEFGNETED